MSDWTKRDQARVEFLDACTVYARGVDSGEEFSNSETMQAHREAVRAKWAIYRDLLDGKEENATLDPNRWFCPHCGSERAPFVFQLIGEALLGLGALQYFNVVCGNESCRKLLSVAIANFIPEKAMLDAARQQMSRFKPQGGGA